MLITQTPIRISFFGGGTDFSGFYRQEEGCVLSTAIDKYIFVVVKRRFDEMVRVGYTRTELVKSVNEIDHELIREALLTTGVNRQIEINTMGDIPATGSGLGSSSSVTVGVLNALYQYLGAPVEMETLAKQACDIEIGRCNKPIGKQDQYIAAYGGFRFIRFLPDERVIVEKVNISEGELRRFNRNLMLFFTNTTRRSETVLDEQKNNINQNIELLHQLKEMAITARLQVEGGDFDSFGHMLHQAWTTKKKLASNITNPEIDIIYNQAREAGAIGGKITGAGGGGFLLLYCPVEHQESVRSALHYLSELPFHFEMDGTKTIFNYRR